MVNMSNRFDLGMGLNRDRIESALLAHRHEGCLQCAERLHVGSRTHVLVAGEERQAINVPHRHDRTVEAPGLPGCCRPLLALDRVSVDIVARKPVFRRDQVGGDALRHEVGWDGDGRIDRPRPPRGADPDAAHRLDTAAHRAILLPGHDLGRGEINSVEAGRAEPVDLDARHVVAIACGQRRGACDVATRFPDRIDAAEHHVVDKGGVEVVTRPKCFEGRRSQPQRRDLVQQSVRLATPAGSADVIIDEGIRHGDLVAGQGVPRCLPSLPKRAMQGYLGWEPASTPT